jgi:hypothetical protein
LAQGIVGLEVKKIPPEATKSWVQSFEIIDGGIKSIRQAWLALEHKFSIRCNDITLDEDKDPDRTYHLSGTSPVSLRPVEKTASGYDSYWERKSEDTTSYSLENCGRRKAG